MLGWAVIGCGWVARGYVVAAIHASRNGRLVAVCDRDEHALAARCGHGFVRTCRTDEAIAHAAVDAVYVATLNDSHAAVASAVAAAGKPVLCEKPSAARSRVCTSATTAPRRTHAERLK